MQIPQLILLLSVATLASGQEKCKCVEPGDDGYLLCSCKKTWKQAEAFCSQAYKGTLALVSNANIQERLRKLLDDEGAQDTWIGANGTKTDWAWVTEKRPISYQGCYQDDANNRELGFDIDLGLDVTPKRCIEECRNAKDNFKYAALQSGGKCFCGNNYGRFGFSSSCSNPCLGDFNQNCGGPQSNQVYLTEALDSGGWAFGSPSSGSGGIDDKECMIYKCEPYLGWTWQNEKCERKFKFLCMYDYDNSTCRLRNKLPTAEACIGYDETEEDSWFLAGEKCREDGGLLLEIHTESSHNSIREALKDKCWLDSMWLGATKINWGWNTGAPLAYTNWANAMPQNEGHKCIAMSYRVSFDYEWRDLSCDALQSFICQKPTIPLITAPTRRPTTPTKTTTKGVGPPIKPIPTEPGFPQQGTDKDQGKYPSNSPQPGSPPAVENLNGTLVTKAPPYQPGDNIPMYVGIAVAIAAFLIIVALIIYCCCIRNKKRGEKMAPARMENGYTNRAGFVHDGDFAYSNVTPTPQGGISNGVIVDKNGYDQSNYKPVPEEGVLPVYSPAVPPAYGEAPPVEVMATKPIGNDVIDDRTATLTSGASSDIGHHRDVSDTGSVNSASSAFIGELDDQNVSIQYVHPRDENEVVRVDPDHQSTLPKKQVYNEAQPADDVGFIQPIANPYPAGITQGSMARNTINQGPPEMHVTTSSSDLTTRL